MNLDAAINLLSRLARSPQCEVRQADALDAFATTAKALGYKEHATHAATRAANLRLADEARQSLLQLEGGAA